MTCWPFVLFGVLFAVGARVLWWVMMRYPSDDWLRRRDRDWYP